MRLLYVLLQKEFRLIFRNKSILRLMFIMPLIQLTLVPMAADYEVKGIKVTLVDHDHSSYSRRLTQKLGASGYFEIHDLAPSYEAALGQADANETDVILTIPLHFERRLVAEQRAEVFLAADAVNGVKAGLGAAYMTSVVRQFNLEIRQEWLALPRMPGQPHIEITSANWYNPHFEYRLFMVPGILAILVTMVGAAMTALNIVEEKEMGTIEQMNVTPVKKYQFILGKLLPFWVIGMISISLGMLYAFLVYRLWPSGSFITLYVMAGTYLLGVLGIGLFISTIAETQQQATLFSFFAMMIFVLLSGLYTSIDSMPGWARDIAAWNPPTYFVRIIRATYIKGSAFSDQLHDYLHLCGFAVLFNALAIWNYRKRSA